MSNINVFLQGEFIKNTQRLQFESDITVREIIPGSASQLGIQVGGEAMVFLEDQDEPLDDTATLGSVASNDSVHLHVHRCREIAVKVNYSGHTKHRAFAPGTTIGKVKHWAAKELGISKEDAAELILQIAGTHEQPDVDVHIGTLATHPQCALAFDLVPNPRIQGAN